MKNQSRYSHEDIAVLPVQRALFLHQQLFPASTAYNMPIVFEIDGALDPAAVQVRVDELLVREEVLRTTFYLKDAEVRQRVRERMRVEIELVEVSEETDQPWLKMILPFDLNVGPLLRCAIIRRLGHPNYLFLDLHHILTDGVGIDRLVALLFLKPGEAPHNGASYIDVVQRKLAQMSRSQRPSVDNGSPRLSFVRPDLVEASKVTSLQEKTEASVAARVRQSVTGLKTSVHNFCLAAFVFQLSRYTNSRQVVIGVPITLRSELDEATVIGPFMRVVPVMFDLAGCRKVRDLVEMVQDAMFAAQDHISSAEDAVFGESRAGGVRVATMFSHKRASFATYAINGARLKPLKVSTPEAKIPFQVVIKEGDDLVFEWEFAAAATDSAAYQVIVGQYKAILREMAASPDAGLPDIRGQTEIDAFHLESKIRESTVVDETESLFASFAEQARAMPKHPAVADESCCLTYEKLALASQVFAAELQAHGVARGSRVAIIAERRIESIVAMLSCLALEATYSPLLPDLPVQRMSRMLDDLRPVCIVSRVANDIIRTPIFPELEPQGARSDFQFEKGTVSADAYIIYTSGSTGQPKGAIITQANVQNLVSGLHEAVLNGLPKGSRFGLLASFAFDASVQQIFAALLRGHTLCIANEAQRMPGPELLDFIKTQRIDVLDCTPTHLAMLVATNGKLDWSGLKKLLIGGELLTTELVLRLTALCDQRLPELYNVYGPTECCVDNTAYQIKITESRAVVAVGKSLRGQSVCVLDPLGKECGLEVVGEVWISGKGVGRGYWNDPTLSANRFQDTPSGRAYRTGDLGLRKADGNIEIVGRIDEQIKIGGFRIELGEINVALRSFAKVRDGVALVREKPGALAEIVAFVVPNTKFLLAELVAHISRKLPAYMLPRRYKFLQMLPMTTSGKIDVQALRQIGLDDSDSGHGRVVSPPRDEVESKICVVFKRFLGLATVGIDEDFFSLGGESLKALRVVSAMNDEFGVRLPSTAVFQSPTVADLAQLVRNAKSTWWSRLIKWKAR